MVGVRLNLSERWSGLNLSDNSRMSTGCVVPVPNHLNISLSMVGRLNI